MTTRKEEQEIEENLSEIENIFGDSDSSSDEEEEQQQRYDPPPQPQYQQYGDNLTDHQRILRHQMFGY